MLFQLIILVCIAFVAASVVFAVYKLLLRRKAPKGLMAAAAGLAIFAFGQWDRYTWAERYAVSLPAGWGVVETYPNANWLEPWTRLFPRQDRALVLDGTHTLRNPDFPHMAVVTTLLVERNEDTLSLTQFVDCAQRRRAPVAASAELTSSGLPPADAWITGGEPRALYDAVCGSASVTGR